MSNGQRGGHDGFRSSFIIHPSSFRMRPVWIIDDDRSIRWVFEKALTRENIAFKTFSSAQEALAALEAETPQVVVSDIRMPGETGLQLLQKAKERCANLPVIIMTAYSDLDSAVAAFQGGAYEYLPKPFDVDHAIELIRRAMEESVRKDSASETVEATPEILGQAPAMQEIFRAIGRLGQSHATVLITGESGTGKELVARALYRHSPRAAKPFIAINTAAIPKELLESELFGHERGAFTGAQNMRRGRFEQAEGGTLFLDEIGDMPADLQTRLLRVLSDSHFYRVGGHQPIKANVRVIAATHQDLEARAKQGLFREDLFHRLNVIRLRLPPLRERREDIPLLTKYFLQKSARELGVEAKRPSEATLKYVCLQDFPGNVRQLENLCHWLTVMAPSIAIEVKDLPPEIRPGAAKPAAEQYWLAALEKEVDTLLSRGDSAIMDELARQFEKTLIVKALAHTGGRRIEASHLLGLGRNTLTRKIQDFGLDGGKERQDS
jgi:two-component system nitrogen regulation response regulator GlnG